MAAVTLVANESGYLLWQCDACRWRCVTAVGIEIPHLWESRGDKTFCAPCVAELNRTDQPRARTSCVAPMRSDPAGHDGGTIRPCEPRRERVAVLALLAFSMVAIGIAVVLAWRLTR